MDSESFQKAPVRYRTLMRKLPPHKAFEAGCMRDIVKQHLTLGGLAVVAKRTKTFAYQKTGMYTDGWMDG